MGSPAVLPPNALRTRPVAACPFCGDPGQLRHARLSDRLFAVPGEWSFRECARSDCGAFWLDPAPIDADLPLAYADYFTHAPPQTRPMTALRRLLLAARSGFLRAHHGGPAVPFSARALGLLAWLHAGWRAELHHRAMHLRVRPGGRLLEVGCGNGELLLGMRDLGWQVTGVDFDPAAAAAARQRGLDVRTGELLAQRLPAASFDAVAMFHLIEHVPDPRALLAECRRLCAAGGQLVVATPNAGSRGHRRFGAAWLELDPPRHLHLFPPRLLARLVEAAGFTVERLTTTLRNAEVTCAGSRAIARSGRFGMHDRPSPGTRLHTLWSLHAALLARAVDPLAAEETVLVARATPGSPAEQ